MSRLKELLLKDEELKDYLTSQDQVAKIHSCQSILEMTETVCSSFKERRALGFKENGKQYYYTYNDIWELCLKLASHLQFKRHEFIALCGFPSPFIYICQLFCLLMGCCVVPLSTKAKKEELEAIINEAQVTHVICDMASSKMFKDLCADVHIVSFDDKLANINFKSLEEESVEQHHPFSIGSPTDTVMLMFTSGSTGTPKGAVYSQKLFLMASRIVNSTNISDPVIPLIELSFLPTNHVMGQYQFLWVFSMGGLLHFTKPDLSDLIDDLLRVQPTRLLLIPRVAELIYRYSENHQVIFNRLLKVAVGSAPLSDEHYARLGNLFGVPVDNTFGATEYGVALKNGRIQHENVLDYKLINENGAACDRGELLVKTKLQITNYFNKPNIEGFIHTGDLFQRHIGSDGEWFEWIDKISNVRKLANGEFVALWSLEAQFISHVVEQIFIYQNDEYPFLMAVVYSSQHSEDEIRRDLWTTGSKLGLEPYKLPRYIIKGIQFTAENHLLTSSGKLNHNKLKNQFESQILES